MDGADFAGVDGLDHLAAAGGYDLAAGGGDDVDFAEDHPKHGDDEEAGDGGGEHSADRRGRLFDNLQRCRQERQILALAVGPRLLFVLVLQGGAADGPVMLEVGPERHRLSPPRPERWCRGPRPLGLVPPDGATG